MTGAAAHPASAEPIRTERLELHAIAPGDLLLMADAPGSPEPWAGKPYTNPYRVLMDDLGPLPWRAPQVRADPDGRFNRWTLVRLIVVRETGEVVGNIGWHGPPDPDGMIEIGLEVAAPMRGRGYAKEALRGMWRWACDLPEVRTLRYTVAPDNAPSIAIVESFGFRRSGVQVDEIDGLELVYELPAAEWLARHGAAG